MKKFLILLVIFCLTGCVSNADFEKTCTSIKKSESIKDVYSIDVSYNNEDIVKKAVITRNYKTLNEEGKAILEDIKNSAISFNEKYAGNEHIKITVSKDEGDEWELKYYLEVPEVSDDILDEFMIKKNSIKFFNKMKEENIECE